MYLPAAILCFRDIGALALEVYVTGTRDSWRSTMLLLLTCLLFSLLLSSLLLLYLLYYVHYGAEVAVGTAVSVGALLAVALFLSKKVRCAGILFLLSCFMKQSRKLLLTAWITFVVLRNVQNIVDNLTGLIGSMICNLQAKKDYITVPLGKYKEMLHWVGDVLKNFPDISVLQFYSNLDISPKIYDGEFKDKLVAARQNLSETAMYVQSVLSTVSSVSHRMFPALSFLLLMMFIALHVKKYCNNLKYQNRFISSRFISFDEKQRAEGRPHVLPLTPDEAKLYVSIPSTRPTSREGKAMLKFGIPIFTHFVAWVVVVCVDALIYHFVRIVTERQAELKPFQVPLIMNLQNIPIFNFLGREDCNKNFSYNVTLFEEKCRYEPKLLFSSSVAPMAVILTALLIMALMAAKLKQLRLILCERFFSAPAEERVEYLHAKILRKRSKGSGAESDESSLRTLVFKAHFWFPLFFRPKEDDGSMV